MKRIVLLIGLSIGYLTSYSQVNCSGIAPTTINLTDKVGICNGNLQRTASVGQLIAAGIDTTKVFRVQQGRGSTAGFTYFNGTKWVMNTNTYQQNTLDGGQIWIGNGSNVSEARTLSGDVTVSNLGVTTLATVNSNVGTFGSATQTPVLVANAKGLITSVSNTTITPSVSSITGLGTGVATALAVNTGTNGSFVVRGSSDYEVPLTFSTGLTRSTNTITNNLSTGVSGGQTITGSTSTNSGLTYKTTTGVGTTGADHIFQVGNNGATEAMRILNNGNVGINTVAPLSYMHISDNNTLHASFASQIGLIGYSLTQNSTSALRLLTSSNTAGFASLMVALRSRGTVTSPTALVQDDVIGGIINGGHDGTGVNYGALIYTYCDATPSAGETPMRISFTTGGSSATRSERMRIKSNGLVGIGTTTPQSLLSVSNNLSVGATYSGTTAAPTNGAIIEGNVGIGTSAPSDRLHVVGATTLNGNLRYPKNTYDLADANYTSTDFSGLMGKTYIRLNMGGSFSTIAGFPAASDGTIIIISVVSNTLAFLHESGTDTAANRLATNTSANVNVPANGSISFIYDATSSRWRQW